MNCNKHRVVGYIVWFQKISITPPQRVIGNSMGEGGFSKAKIFKAKSIGLNWNFQRGRGQTKKTPPYQEYGFFFGTTHCHKIGEGLERGEQTPWRKMIT